MNTRNFQPEPTYKECTVGTQATVKSVDSTFRSIARIKPMSDLIIVRSGGTLYKITPTNFAKMLKAIRSGSHDVHITQYASRELPFYDMIDLLGNPNVVERR